MSKTIQWALVLLSGLCFYFGFSLNGNFGWLIWIAPIPVLYTSLIVKPRQAVDWFGTVNLFVAIGFIIFLFKRKKPLPG